MEPMANTLRIHIDRDSKKPAYRQLYQQIREQIRTGEIPSGAKLPKIRELAQDLGIARNTVEAAYKQLGVEGYAKSTRGIGYVVENLDFSILETASTQGDGAPKARKRMWLHEHPLGDSLGCCYDFSYGNRDARGAAAALLKNFANQALSEANMAQAFEYMDTFGLPGLREELASYVNEEREMSCSPDDIVIMPGTQAALDAIISFFPFEERRIALENPGYARARAIFRDRASRIVPVPVYGSSSAFLRGLERSNARLAFFTPSNQFPLGFIMPLATRLKVIEWAKHADAYIIEDDYCYEYRYGSDPVPSLYSLCPDRVIYLGTLSKILTPAMRLTYVVLPPRLTERWDKERAQRHCCVPWLDQEMLSLFMKSTEWQIYKQKTVGLYHRRRDVLLESIEREMGDEVTVLGADTGQHILLGDNLKRDQEELVSLARKNDVRVYETSSYWTGKTRLMNNYVLVGYSQIGEADIAEGISRLADAWRK